MIDDETLITETLCVILTAWEYEAVPASDIETALKLAGDLSPDLLIVDPHISGKGGLTLAVQVRNVVPACKVILFSGRYIDPELLGHLELAESSLVVIKKPLHPLLFLRAVAGILDTAD